jgi:hypothetical protein
MEHICTVLENFAPLPRTGGRLRAPTSDDARIKPVSEVRGKNATRFPRSRASFFFYRSSPPPARVINIIVVLSLCIVATRVVVRYIITIIIIILLQRLSRVFFISTYIVTSYIPIPTRVRTVLVYRVLTDGPHRRRVVMTVIVAFYTFSRPLRLLSPRRHSSFGCRDDLEEPRLRFANVFFKRVAPKS